MSMFPPTRRGGTILCVPVSAGATPIVPQNGLSGTRPPGSYAQGVSCSLLYFQIVKAGSGNCSAKSPNPGIIAVQPQPDGEKDSIVTLSVSPGLAPSINTGPVTGFTFSKSSATTSATLELTLSWPPEASIVPNSTESPGATVITGRNELSHPK